MIDPKLIESTARVLSPRSWEVMDGYLADMLRKYKGQDIGYDPDAFKDKESMALATAVLAHLDTMGALSFQTQEAREMVEACRDFAESHAAYAAANRGNRAARTEYSTMNHLRNNVIDAALNFGRQLTKESEG